MTACGNRSSVGDERRIGAAASIGGRAAAYEPTLAYELLQLKDTGGAAAPAQGGQQRRTGRSQTRRSWRRRRARPPCVGRPAAAGNPTAGHNIMRCFYDESTKQPCAGRPAAAGKPAAGHDVMRCCNFSSRRPPCANHPQQQRTLQQPAGVDRQGPTSTGSGNAAMRMSAAAVGLLRRAKAWLPRW